MYALTGKYYTLQKLAQEVRQWKSECMSIALCHGCFDPLHVGHIKHFCEASKLADKLVVTVTPDRYVNKGPDRPYFHEEDRLFAIASLSMVDACALNLWPDSIRTIEMLKPDFYVKGVDYKDMENCNPNIINERKALEQYHGRMYFTSTEKLSSTELIKKNAF